MGAFEEKVGWLVVLAFARSLGLKAFEGEGRGVDLDGEPLGIGVARLAVDLGELLLEPLRERPLLQSTQAHRRQLRHSWRRPKPHTLSRSRSWSTIRWSRSAAAWSSWWRRR